jgi:hypothetical protein
MIRAFFRRIHGLRLEYLVPKSNPAVRDRVQMVNKKLRNAQGEVEMLISPKCKNLILDFEEVVYKPDSGVIDKTRDMKRTHMSDALGYLVWQECRPHAAPGEKSGRLLY